ncbi:RDD family protein [Actinomadura parmotrematis]|uniref:RDD family protein n=1 Tax=Actinomadura parmotrematis TaxID=2864039 RepID=A0ABS7FKN3_9ACTN|nr:RDD family protein [Actinomadura parmotrematis]MBW8480805.1 RDD family protein [Actinomadura parmotrematis]
MSSGKQGGPGGQRWTQTWLGGARSAGVDLGRPGERLGLPAEGSGSAAGYGRRLGALFIDWVIALLISTLLTRVLDWTPSQRSLTTLAVFALMSWILVGTAGVTIGKGVTGIRVARLGGGPVGPVWALVRAVLLVLVVPAMIWDRDYRGLHDRAADTVVVNR